MARHRFHFSVVGCGVWLLILLAATVLAAYLYVRASGFIATHHWVLNTRHPHIGHNRRH